MSSKIVEQSRSGLLGIGKKMLANERSARCSYLAMMTGFPRRGCFGRAQYRAAEWTALVSHAVLRGAILSVHARDRESAV